MFFSLISFALFPNFYAAGDRERNLSTSTLRCPHSTQLTSPMANSCLQASYSYFISYFMCSTSFDQHRYPWLALYGFSSPSPSPGTILKNVISVRDLLMETLNWHIPQPHPPNSPLPLLLISQWNRPEHFSRFKFLLPLQSIAFFPSQKSIFPHIDNHLFISSTFAQISPLMREKTFQSSFTRENFLHFYGIDISKKSNRLDLIDPSVISPLKNFIFLLHYSISLL